MFAFTQRAIDECGKDLLLRGERSLLLQQVSLDLVQIRQDHRTGSAFDSARHSIGLGSVAPDKEESAKRSEQEGRNCAQLALILGNQRVIAGRTHRAGTQENNQFSRRSAWQQVSSGLDGDG